MKRLYYFTAAAMIFLLSCSTTGSNSGTKSNPYWNEMALYLAGMPLPEKSIFKTRTNTDYYKKHVEYMNMFWAKLTNKNLVLINPWRDENIPKNLAENTAFYPLSGADFVNIHSFFPKAKNYIMLALEEPGEIPDPLSLTDAQLQSGIGSVERAIWTVAGTNYMVSMIMEKELNNRYLKGTTPAIMIFMARFGLTITNVSAVGLDQSGDVKRLDVAGLIDGKKPEITGTKIFFTAKNDSRERSVTYLKVRLSSKSLVNNTPDGLFLKKLNNINMILKSAVYLFHVRTYADLAEHFMSKSDLIIQDDSGIPYRLFDQKKWNVTLFGDYIYPMKLKDLQNPPYQADLAKDYLLKKVPLSFDYGYGVIAGKGKSNLLRGIKQKI